MERKVHTGASVVLGLLMLTTVGMMGVVVAITPQAVTHCRHSAPPYLGPAFPIVDARNIPGPC